VRVYINLLEVLLDSPVKSLETRYETKAEYLL
jgi:hypothetical protein